MNKNRLLRNFPIPQTKVFSKLDRENTQVLLTHSILTTHNEIIIRPLSVPPTPHTNRSTFSDEFPLGAIFHSKLSAKELGENFHSVTIITENAFWRLEISSATPTQPITKNLDV